MSMDTHDSSTVTREAWLWKAIEALAPRFEEIGLPVDLDKVRVSVGFGSTGARQENSVILGVTYARSCSADDHSEIFISPEDADTTSMLATLMHELGHAADDLESGHKGRFAEAMTRLGLEGKMTATTPSIELAADLMVLAAELGEYPGAKLDIKTAHVPAPPVGPDGLPIPGWVPPRTHSGSGPQTARMIKHSCRHEDCDAHGYTVRIARSWVSKFGPPICPGNLLPGHRLVES